MEHQNCWHVTGYKIYSSHQLRMTEKNEQKAVREFLHLIFWRNSKIVSHALYSLPFEDISVTSFPKFQVVTGIDLA